MSTTTRTPPNARIAELEARAAVMATEMDSLLAKPSLSPQQADRLANLTTAAERLAGQIEEARAQDEARMGRIREHAANPAHVQSGDGARTWDFQAMRRADDPWAGDLARSAMHQTPMELRDRAMVALDRSGLSQDAQTVAEPLIRDTRDALTIGGRWALATTNPAYSSAFTKYLRNPHLGHAQYDEAERQAFLEMDSIRTAMNEGTTTQGQYLVPAQLDPAINILNAGGINPLRKIARVERTTSFQWQPVTSAGVEAAYSTESTEVADNSPTIARPTIQMHRASAHVQASWELASDAANLGDEVSRMIQDAKDRLESSIFINGTGGGQPWGLITRLTSVAGAYVFGNSGSTVESAIAPSDIYDVDNALDARYQSEASWLAHRATYNSIRQLATGSGPQHAFWADYSDNRPPSLIGHPCFEASSMDSVVSSGSEDAVLVLGAFKNWVIVDRVGLTLMYNPLVLGAANNRPSGEVSWTAFWRNGADLLDATNASGFKFLHK